MSIYDRKKLTRALQIAKRPSTLLRDTFFTETERFTTKEVYMDMEVEVRNMAEYNVRGNQSKTVKTPGYSTQIYTPPIISLNDVVDETGLMNRIPGETEYQTTPEAAELYRVQKILSGLDARITRREEFQCMEALTNGEIDLENGDTVGFNRHADHTVTLTGSDEWDQSASDPYEQFLAWRQLLVKNGSVNGTDVIMGQNAWKLLRNNTKFLALMDKYKVNIGMIEPMPVATGVSRVMVLPEIGTFWTYDAYYIDPADGTEKLLLPTNKVIYTTRDARFTKYYGAVAVTEGERVNLVEGVRVVDTEIKKDPAVKKIIVQSAPLMVTNNANAVVCAEIYGG